MGSCFYWHSSVSNLMTFGKLFLLTLFCVQLNNFWAVVFYWHSSVSNFQFSPVVSTAVLHNILLDQFLLKYGFGWFCAYGLKFATTWGDGLILPQPRVTDWDCHTLGWLERRQLQLGFLFLLLSQELRTMVAYLNTMLLKINTVYI